VGWGYPHHSRLVGNNPQAYRTILPLILDDPSIYALPAEPPARAQRSLSADLSSVLQLFG
jgi:hypothetical protein